jgi:hypothetical protein
MKTSRRLLAVLLVPALLLLFPAPARMVTSAQAGLYPASAGVASPMTCWVFSEIGSGNYLYSFEVWRDGAFHAAGPQRSADSFFSFTPALPGSYHVLATVIDSAYGNQVTVQTAAARVSLRPGPAVQAEAVNGTALKVSWTPVAAAAGYEVWRGTSRAGTYRLARFVSGTSFTNTYLQGGTQYFYKVRSVHLIGGVRHVSGAFSAPACGVPLAKAAITSVKPAGTGRVLLGWAAVPGATGYEVSVSASLGGAYRVVRTTSALSLTVTGLNPAAPYYFMVRAYRRIGTVNYYSRAVGRAVAGHQRVAAGGRRGRPRVREGGPRAGRAPRHRGRAAGESCSTSGPSRRRDLRLLRNTPAGAAIGTCRYKLGAAGLEDYRRIIDVLRAHDIGFFFYIGGNDSMDTAHKIARWRSAQGYDADGGRRAQDHRQRPGRQRIHADRPHPGYGSSRATGR